MNIIVDLCLIPIGTGVSLSKYIAICTDLIEESGLNYQLGPNGTAIEGEWNEVFKVIHSCHEKIHEMGVNRISSSLKIGSRIDRTQTIKEKVESVNSFRERKS